MGHHGPPPSDLLRHLGFGRVLALLLEVVAVPLYVATLLLVQAELLLDFLEDLIIAAHKDAKDKSEAQMAEKTKALTAGLPIPPGFKLPF